MSQSNGFPFLRNRFWVDFTSPEKYGRRLYELVQGIRGLDPDPDGEIEGALEPPPRLPEIATVHRDRELSLFDSAFEELEDVGVMLLFAQEGMGAGGSDLLIDGARRRFGQANVFHVSTIACGEEESDGYFLDVARQLGLPKNLRKIGALAARFPDLLSHRKQILIVLTNFENGPSTARYGLASALRSLLDSEKSKVRIIIRGGEKLAALKYEMGDLSLLNIAGTRLWPDLTEADIEWISLQRKPAVILSAGEAHQIVKATGGEPRLVGHCLRSRASASRDCLDYEQVVRDYDIATAWFLPLKRKGLNMKSAKRLAEAKDLGVFTSVWFSDPVKRHLFWRNAFTVREIEGRKRIFWRSEAFREAALAYLRCND